VSRHEAAVHLTAPAKINARLRVTRRRDDGFHDIDTVFVALDLADEVQLTPSRHGITGDTHFEDTVLARHDLQGMQPSNLAYRAAQRWLAAADADVGVHIVVHKRIPVAGGLGGGSSDAAAVLRGMNRLYGALPDDQLSNIALELGSDVPFFLKGWPAARGRGRGEKLKELHLPKHTVVLANPGAAVSAGFAYQQLLSYGEPLDDAIDALWQDPGSAQDNVRNDLEPGVRAGVPDVAAALDALSHVGLSEVTLSGSGGTVFGLASSASAGQAAADALRDLHPSWWVKVTHAPSWPDVHSL
jgi:4-diphosphocytidyl-2-C-methyl-D-erythritol kinase